MRTLEFSYQTPVRVNLDGFEDELQSLKKAYESIPGGRDTHEGRSAFSRWNNLTKFYERLMNPLSGFQFIDAPSDEYPNSKVICVTAKASGSSTRIYMNPSVTSLTKEVRKFIVPIKPGNRLVFFDLRAAEFIMNAIFAGEDEAYNYYSSGNDVYMFYKNLFPVNTPRKTIKTILIAQMYGTTPYRVGQQLGISDTVAERLLNRVFSQIPRMTALKQQISDRAQRLGVYTCPNEFNQQDLVQVSAIDPLKGYNHNLALSVYTQSALGLFAQTLTTKIRKRTSGVMLSVFDSFLAEINPENYERYKLWITEQIKPFVTDKIVMGKSFWDAAYS